MEWKIDGQGPIWLQLYAALTRRILAGEYPAGTRLPSVRELAAEAGVNPNTMQRALAYLEEQGLAVGNGTQGRVVTDDQQLLASARRTQALALLQETRTALVELGFTAQEAKELWKEGESTWND